MTWRFKPAEVKTVDLKDAAPGDFLLPLRPNDDGELWLRLAGEPPVAPMVNLTGPRAFHVWSVRPQGRLPTLLLARGPSLELEIAGEGIVSGRDEQPGDLVIGEAGAFVAAVTQVQGFANARYISLASWTIFEYPVQRAAVFSTWRLVDVSRPEEKRVVFSFGDWPSGTVG